MNPFKIGMILQVYYAKGKGNWEQWSCISFYNRFSPSEFKKESREYAMWWMIQLYKIKKIWKKACPSSGLRSFSIPSFKWKLNKKPEKKIVNRWMFLPPAPVGSRRSRSRLHSLHAPASPSWCAGCARASRYRRWSARSSGLAGRSRSDSGTTAAHRTAWRTEDNRRLSGSPGHIGIVPN